MKQNRMQTSKFREISVKDIMQGERQAIILHADKRYSLTITRRGKLILTAANAKEVASQ